MGSGHPGEHRGRDLDSRAEIEELVVRFYRDVAQDQQLGHYFNTIARVDWYDHTGRLTDFWCGILLGEPAEAIDVPERHRWLHEHTPFSAEHFERWLEAFTTTVDAGWTGPRAELAKKRAKGMAGVMARRLLARGPLDLAPA
jgi:hemoglobin